MKTARKFLSLFIVLSAVCTYHGIQAQQTDTSSQRLGNSAEFSAERIEQGKKMYKQFCLRCHGPEMNNSGNAFDLRTFPLDQRDRFFNSVTNGKRQMPPWKGTLTDEDIEILWTYVGSRGGTLQP
jgi:mono/diheme cytochrome c family protein